MAVGDETTQSLTSNTTVHTLTVVGRTTDAQSPEIIYGGITNKKVDVKQAAHRAAVASADSGDISSSAVTLFDVGHSQFVQCHCSFASVSTSAVVMLGMFDAYTTPGFMGITEKVTFVGDASFTDGTNYVSPRYFFDVGVASSVRAFVSTAPSTGSVTIYLEAV